MSERSKRVSGGNKIAKLVASLLVTSYLGGNELAVDGVAHAEEEVEGFSLEGFIGVVEAFDDGELVGGGVLRVVLDYHGEAGDSQVF